MTDEGLPPTLLLVHGAWHGAWCWEKVTSALEGDGWRTRTVDLPSAGSPAGVRDDARALLRELESIDGPVVVVAHSYGGIPVSEAVAEARNVAHIVHLAAFQLDVGESLLGFLGVSVPPGTDGLDAVPDDPVPLFYGDVPVGVAEEAVSRLVPQSSRSAGDVLTAAGWRTVPSTYIVCEDDQAVPARTQEVMAARSATVHRIATSHSPFLSKPVELAALLARIALGSVGSRKGTFT
ncbi:alpha/beta fold hydrolase [Streptomyces sp. NPDC014870]|uniref:alpha/beta fold hydrolase n=1 Tax=Streptomyces sp. NPDC014870 TaxID=3364925 RepID=UPI0036F8BC96